MKKLFAAISILLIITFLPINVFASENLQDRLPKLELPEIEQLEPMEVPELSVPKLSKDYDEMLNKLKEQGYGKFKYDKEKGLELPKVESPKGAGKSAVDKFKEEYGDMWNNNKLKDINNMPDDKFFDMVKSFGKANQEEFNRLTKEDREKMAKLLKQKLDTSIQYDLDSIKAKANKGFMSQSEIQRFLRNTPKPEGWDRVAASIPKAPNKNSWLNSYQGEGFDDFSLNIPGGLGGNLASMLSNLGGKIGGKIKEWLGEEAAARETNKEKAKELADKIRRGEKITDAELKEYKQSIKDVTNARLKPVKDAANAFMNYAKKREQEANDKRTIDVYIAEKEAKAKYGEGNYQYIGDILGKPRYVNKNSLVGKAANKLISFIEKFKPKAKNGAF